MKHMATNQQPEKVEVYKQYTIVTKRNSADSDFFTSFAYNTESGNLVKCMFGRNDESLTKIKLYIDKINEAIRFANMIHKPK